MTFPTSYSIISDEISQDLPVIRSFVHEFKLPGIELRSYWGSQAAKTDGSFNLAGISDPVVDQLIDKVVAAKLAEAAS